MTRIAADKNANTDCEETARPYAPSWVNRLAAWLARLPIPGWSFYLGVGLILLLLQGSVLWVEGAFSFPQVHRAHTFLAVAIPFFLALMYYLDERASSALTGMRSDLDVNQEVFRELHYRLTVLPMVPTLLASFVALGCALLIEASTGEPYNLAVLQSFPVSANLLRVFYLLCWWIFGAFLFHTIHQLRRINRIYTEYTHINLFRMKSLYALSNLAALTAGSLVLIPYGFLLANELTVAIWQDPAVYGVYLVITFFAIVTFIWPQLGIHRLQVVEKERLLEEANGCFEAVVADLHERLDSGQLEEMTNLNVALANLEMERAALGKIRTWPWEPETVRLLITALALPMGLWLLQYVMQRMLGS
jgi:hypothetical protein